MKWRYVILKEHIPDNGDWLVAQVLEHDIAVQVRTLEELPKAIAVSIIGNIELAAEHGTDLRDPSNWERAPQEFWDMPEHHEMDIPDLAAMDPRWAEISRDSLTQWIKDQPDADHE